MGNNRFKAMLAAGEAAYGGWCSIGNSFSAEIVATSGCDYVTVDMQHGLAAFADLVGMLQAISLQGATPLVRIPPGDYATAQRALDAGAEGIIVPYIESLEEALTAAKACRYPPDGVRSFGPIRSRLHIGIDPVHANRQIMCILMVETEKALKNISEIVQAPGVDGIYVGPADLALSLGTSGVENVYGADSRLGENSSTSRTLILESAIESIVRACRAAGTPAGIHAQSGALAAEYVRRGFSFASVATDAALLARAYQSEVAAAHRTATPGLPGAAVAVNERKADH